MPSLQRSTVQLQVPFLSCSLFCSLACFKKHKENPCVMPVASEAKTTADPELPMEGPLTVDDTTEVLLKPQLESVASSNEIRAALKIESLRKLISSIDSAPDPENALDKAMGEEAFRIFTDKVLWAIDR